MTPSEQEKDLLIKESNFLSQKQYLCKLFLPSLNKIR